MEVATAEEPVWKDKTILSLKPRQGAEVKLVMEKGRGVPDDQGELEAAFTGNHGWFFRNHNDKTVMVILKTNGDYAGMKRVL